MSGMTSKCLGLAFSAILTLGCEGGTYVGEGGKKQAGSYRGLPPGAQADLPEEAPVAAGTPENAFEAAADAPMSTFSIDVDTASYTMARAEFMAGRKPDASNVRIEEFINYFTYELAQPQDEHPFAVTADVAPAPWAPEHRLVRIGLKGKEVAPEARPAANLVFLIDVSGSMDTQNRLGLVKHAMKALTSVMNASDRVAIVTYAGSSGIALASTPGDQQDVILGALENLRSGGGTNGEAGIALAYSVASANMIAGGVNRVILCTDGDFNLGQTSSEALVAMIQQKAEGGIFLTALGFGMGYNDPMLETLADKGNGIHGYIDTKKEAERMLVQNANGALITIAKDVKIQVAFDPALVARYRLVGYENRMLEDKDFIDDKKDAGEIGAGHTVTALYEVELVPGVQTPAQLATLKLRYKLPTAETSIEMETAISDTGAAIEAASTDLRFAAAVAGFGMLLRNSQFKGTADWANIAALAEGAVGADLKGERKELVALVKQAARLP